MISSIDSSAAARPTSGSEPAPRPSVTCAPSWISRGCLGHGQRLRIGVGSDEFSALQALGDHVVDGVTAAAADADHRNSWPHFGNPVLGVRHRNLLRAHLSCRLRRSIGVRIAHQPKRRKKAEPGRKNKMQNFLKFIRNLFR
jgi:hypothetical protein